MRTAIVVSGTLGIGTGLALHPLEKAIFGQEAASCTDSITTTVIETMTYTVRDTANVAQARTSYDSSGTTLITVAGAWAPEKKVTKTSYCGADATATKTKRSLMAYFRSLAMSQS